MTAVLLALLLLLQTTGTIEGRVLNVDGTPAVNVRVAAQPVGESPAAAAETPVLASIAQTDAAGRYRLEGVAPGRYYVGAGLVDSATYYPGVTALTDARVVSIAASGRLDEIDFQMRRAAGLKVSGRVIREGPQLPAIRPAQTQQVRLSGEQATQTREAPIGPDGTYEFTGVAPGWHVLSFSPTIPGVLQEIVLEVKDLLVDLRIPITIPINGTLLGLNNVPKPRVTLLFVSDTYQGTVSFLSDGRLSWTLIPGEYRVRLNPDLPTGYSLKSITVGGRDLPIGMDNFSEPFRVSLENPPVIGVTVTVSSPPPWVKVSGRVVGIPPQAFSRPLGVNVTMSGTSAAETLQTPIDRDGTFSFARVIPGAYSVRLSMTPVPQGLQPLSVRVENTDLENIEIVIN
jgi:hypothetical protein